MLIIVIATHSYQEAYAQIQQALLMADGIELRLDYFPVLDLIEIARLRAFCTLPLIFTLRSATQGGQYAKTEKERIKDIWAICALTPDYVDLEFFVAEEEVRALSSQYPTIKWIRSYHDFQSTPLELSALLECMTSSVGDVYKIVSYARNTLDALRMLHFAKQYAKSYALSAFCMGAQGVLTRILAPLMGTYMTYTYLEHSQPVAIGQLSIETLLHIYHYRRLNADTKVYALLGEPVDLSIGHIVHNQAMIYLDKNAVYIKLQLSAEELPSAWHFFQEAMWAGMSVTMPLKEKMVPLLDELETTTAAMQAVNTVVRKSSHWYGINTDGLGAWQALSQYLEGKRHTLVILGAGGAARAVAYEAKRQGIKSLILNRTLDKAQCLANEVEGEAYELHQLSDLKPRYTAIINTLPTSAFSSVSLPVSAFNATAIAMDIVYQPIQTVFLERAAEAGCRCVFGYEMYIHQALGQIQHWFQPPIEVLNSIKAKMYAYFERHKT
ncbi:MAG TPA: type I 3-dehydroquinate dehydratase [Legionellaceae bacterium]|nr:type I 3-dehydroquinate dehydratase [Legionellaceae bacterium]